MSGFEGLLEFVRQNLVPTIIFLVVAVSVLRRIVKQASEDQARRRAGGPLVPSAPDDELREQVRRGFESMMRQRAAAAGAARAPQRAPQNPAATKPATQRPALQRPALQKPSYQGAAPQRPTPYGAPKSSRVPAVAPKMAPAAPPAPIEVARAAAAAAATREQAGARERLATRRLTQEMPSIVRRVLGDRDSVRRAFLQREILDLPRSLRTGS
jgi:hypothetical protein